MSANRAEAVDRQFIEHVRALAARGPGGGRSQGSTREVLAAAQHLTGARLLEMFESQLVSRHLDLAMRGLRARGRGYYTIGSAGHEGNVVLGDLLRGDDPCFLHYRSGALMVQRSRKHHGSDEVRDALRGACATVSDPVSGGRHKVWGSRALWVPPQTSTIASQLPKALGAALAIYRGRRLGLDTGVSPDAIACVSMGDASVNHSTAQGTLNAAGWLRAQQLPLPLLFVCEDNGIGISVGTPAGWIEASCAARPGIEYFQADGLDLVQAWEVAREAIELVRRERRPAFLHLRVVRLLGHAGSDIETEYRTLEEIAANERLDPLLRSAEAVIEAGLMLPEGVLELYESTRRRVEAVAEEVEREPGLTSADEVAKPLGRHTPERVRAEAARPAAQEASGGKRVLGRQRHLAAMINRALAEALVKYPELLVFGEDVAKKGGVYHVTAGLWKEFGPGRVFNTLLDEQAILGLAMGAAQLGFLPVPEIQYLAYLHNAEDQLRSEACSLSFFSAGQFQNPMLVRIAAFAYQKGFGGHFHNDNSIAVLRDIPGIVLCAPARGDDAVKLLRTCLALARVDGRVVVFLEPIALYMTKDLHEDGDGLWLSDYPEQGEAIPLGEGRVYHPEAGDLTIVSYANGLWRSLRAARLLREQHGIAARVIDLRWLAPLDHALVAREALATGRLLVVDECRRAGGLGEAIVAGAVERAGSAIETSLLAAADTYLPLGPAMDLCLPDEAGIVAAARELVGRPGRRTLVAAGS